MVMLGSSVYKQKRYKNLYTMKKVFLLDDGYIFIYKINIIYIYIYIYIYI